MGAGVVVTAVVAAGVGLPVAVGLVVLAEDVAGVGLPVAVGLREAAAEGVELVVLEAVEEGVEVRLPVVEGLLLVAGEMVEVEEEEEVLGKNTTRRTRLLDESAIERYCPVRSKATPLGAVNSALVGGPPSPLFPEVGVVAPHNV